MLKTEDTYSLALAEIKNNLARKNAGYERSIAEAYSKDKRLSEIDNLLSRYGAKVAITALSGDKETLAQLQGMLSELTCEKKERLQAQGVKEVEFDCKLCNDTGYISGKVCGCVKALAKKIAIGHLSGSMPIYDCRFDNFDLKYYPDTENENGINPRKRMTGILKLCREYVIDFSPKNSANLLFMGDTGLGKTHLTLAMVSGVIDKGYNVVYGSAYNLFSLIENEHFSFEKGDSYETMLNCDLLVIDDLGTEFVTSFIQSVLYGLINSRILSGKPTIINTNLTMAEIENRYSPRISSRLIGSYTAKKFCGKDIRQLKIIEKK
ncbi:MAG: ATP-binding protein [Clostridia bacterium]|nr:ATP-binding protein [Clostridia bacterium]